MKSFDYLLQRERIRQVNPFLKPNSYLLDIGCSDGPLLKYFAPRIKQGVGIDPLLNTPSKFDNIELVPGWFPDDLPGNFGSFDTITALAVVEHIPVDKLSKQFIPACLKLLNPGGQIILTVPSNWVDPILDVLKFLKFVDGMEIEQHYGFEPKLVPVLFAEMRLVKHSRFEFGLNNLFVFEKPPSSLNSNA
jgi:SAM-dependent methyltransferase